MFGKNRSMSTATRITLRRHGGHPAPGEVLRAGFSRGSRLPARLFRLDCVNASRIVRLSVTALSYDSSDVVAGHEVVVADLAQLWFLGRAVVGREGAPRPKTTARWRVQWRRQITFDLPDVQRVCVMSFGVGNRIQQQSRLWMPHSIFHVRSGRYLTDLPEVRHHHPVTDALHHRHVVGDEDHRQVELADVETPRTLPTALSPLGTRRDWATWTLPSPLPERRAGYGITPMPTTSRS